MYDMLHEQEFRENKSKHIVFCSDKEYLRYLFVTLNSLSCHAEGTDCQVVIFFDGELSVFEKKWLLGLEKAHFSIACLDFSKFLSDNFFGISATTRDYWSLSMWHKCFIPLVFSDIDKVVYCDCDLIFESNPLMLFDIDLCGKSIGAVLDSVVFVLDKYEYRKKFIREALNILDEKKYFNSGVVVFDLSKINVDEYKKSLSFMMPRKDLLYPDQDFLNAYFKNEVCFLDPKYNFQCNVFVYEKDYANYLTEPVSKKLKSASDSPVVIHYIGDAKPWRKQESLYRENFWAYARGTPYYELMQERYLLAQHQLQPQDSLLFGMLKQCSRIVLPYGTRRRYFVKKLLGL